MNFRYTAVAAGVLCALAQNTLAAEPQTIEVLEPVEAVSYTHLTLPTN